MATHIDRAFDELRFGAARTLNLRAMQPTAIQATTLAPADPREAAILITLQPGAYTAIVSGANGGVGVGIIEVFAR
jgi:hypothetical protein